MTKTCENRNCINGEGYIFNGRPAQRFCGKMCAVRYRSHGTNNNHQKSPLPFLTYNNVPRIPKTRNLGEKRLLIELAQIRKEMVKRGYPLWNDFLDESVRYRKEWNDAVEKFAVIEAERIRREIMNLLISF